MWAYNLHGVDDLRFENVLTPSPKEGEILLKVMAAGICGSDIPRVFRTGTYYFPTVIGHEFAGIDSISGKRYGVFPLIPCFKCKQCKNQNYEMCSDYGYLGSRQNGGFAEYVTVPKWNLIELPDEVSFEQAAMLEPMAVAVHAIRKASPKKEDVIIVQGLGTIGLLLIMFLKSEGFKNIVAIGSKDIHCKFASEFNVSYIDRDDSNTVNNANVFFDCVGKNDVIKNGINCLGPLGKLVCIGNPSSDISFEKELYWKILRKQLTLIGSWNSSFTKKEDDDWHYVILRLKLGLIKPEVLITHKLHYNSLFTGLSNMRQKKDYIKEMLYCY